MSESVKETIDRVMQQAGYYDNWRRAQEVQKLPELKYYPDLHK